eukprot:5410961-Prymnesium_polylepis.3
MPPISGAAARPDGRTYASRVRAEVLRLQLAQLPQHGSTVVSSKYGWPPVGWHGLLKLFERSAILGDLSMLTHLRRCGCAFAVHLHHC